MFEVNVIVQYLWLVEMLIDEFVGFLESNVYQKCKVDIFVYGLNVFFIFEDDVLVIFILGMKKLGFDMFVLVFNIVVFFCDIEIDIVKVFLELVVVSIFLVIDEKFFDIV